MPGTDRADRVPGHAHTARPQARAISPRDAFDADLTAHSCAARLRSRSASRRGRYAGTGEVEVAGRLGLDLLNEARVEAAFESRALRGHRLEAAREDDLVRRLPVLSELRALGDCAATAGSLSQPIIISY